MVKPLSEARIALVFEWFQKFGGVERVVAEMWRAFPNTELFALVHDPESFVGTPLQGTPVRTSFLQSLPWVKERYRSYLPLMPMAVEQFDLRPYDVVVSSSHAVAKGVLTRADQLHVSYTHTPVRYAWDLYVECLDGSGMDRGIKSLLARPVLHYLRLWDCSAANRVDAYLANSFNVARRIGKLYRRRARVVYPPVDVERFRPDLPREEFFVVVSRLVPYKSVDLIVETFTRIGSPLIVIGDGPEFDKVRRMAGPNVRLLGYQPDETVAEYLQRAKAFVLAADEDFGISALEAQAAGCPVIAHGRGGALETVVGWPAPNPTGVFFENRVPETLEMAVKLFESRQAEFESGACRRNAERFRRERFQRELHSTLEELWSRFQGGEPLDSDLSVLRGALPARSL